MSLICAGCGVFLDREPYYGHCTYVPYCCQQHAREDQRRHRCEELTTMMGDLLVHCENQGSIDPALLGRAFTGDIMSMIMLLGFVQGAYVDDVKMFLLALFPPVDHANVRILFQNQPMHDLLLDYFVNRYQV